MRTKIYTKGGDKGQTSLFGGARVSKGHLQLEAYGNIDELNAFLGLCLADLADFRSAEGDSAAVTRLQTVLSRTQNELFNIGGQLACGDDSLRPKLPDLDDTFVNDLEKEIDAMTILLPELHDFIMPGGTRLASSLHLGRTVCRRAEREVVRARAHYEEAVGENASSKATTLEIYRRILVFLNRLSDYLFVAARFANLTGGQAEIKWRK